MDWLEWTTHEISKETGRIERPEHAYEIKATIVEPREVPLGHGIIGKRNYMRILWACKTEDK